MGLKTRLTLARLAVIAFADPDKQRLVDLADAVFAGGADMLQLRFEQVPPQQRQALAEAARSIALQYPRSLLVIRDEVGIARAMQADVIHVGAAGVATAQAREGQSEYALLGRSAHDVAALDAAQADAGVDYVTLGPVLQPADAAHRTDGLELVREAARRHPAGAEGTKPWFAQGGITPDTLDDVLAAGARRVVVGHAVVTAADPEAATRALADRMAACWSADESMQRLMLGGGKPVLSFDAPAQQPAPLAGQEPPSGPQGGASAAPRR